MTFLRHLAAFVLLPVTVAVIVPIWVARRRGITFAWPDGFGQMMLVAAGLALLLVGVALFIASLRLFATQGRGTLAPWDPPRTLVIRGPYRYVRNPMISGVTFMLFAEALILRSMPHARWAVLILAINLVYIPLVEEPQLEARFGDGYRRYKHRVPRFIPLVRPRTDDDAAG